MHGFQQLELDLMNARSSGHNTAASGHNTAVNQQDQLLPAEDQPELLKHQLSDGQMLWWRFYIECETRDLWKAAVNHPNWLGPLTERLSGLPQNR